jgi:4-amino-4-deoxy-L-arabinose transferase-like glycosyltransferase
MSKREHVCRVAVLIALVAVSHAWLIGTSVSLAPDTIRFLRYAARLREEPALEVMRREVQHPLFPAAIAAVHPVVQWLASGPPTEVGRVAAQVTATLCALALVVPLYGIVLELFSPRAAWWSCLLLVLLPVPNRVTADGLSDGMQLLWIACGVWAALIAVQRGRPAWLAACGAAIGLAYLTRPEGALLGVAVLLTLAAMQLTRSYRWPWPRMLAGSAGLVWCAAAFIAPYVAVKDGLFTKKNSFRVMVGMRTLAANDAPLSSEPGSADRANTSADSWRAARAWLVAAQELANELLDIGHYFTAGLALLALVVSWAPAARRPGAWLLALLGTLFTLLLLRLHVTTGYLASRHTLVLLLVMLPWAGCDLALFQGRIERWLSARGRARLALNRPVFSSTGPGGDGMGSCPAGLARRCRVALLGPAGSAPPRLAGALLTLLLAALCVPKLSQPLHRSRWGNRQAARWLAARCGRDTAVLDPHALAAFYAPCRCYSQREIPRALRDPALKYVVVDTADLDRHDGPYRQLGELVARLGEPAARFPLYPSDSEPGILIFSVPTLALGDGDLRR